MKSVILFISIVLSILINGIISKGKNVMINEHPNIIFIFADDLGYGGLGCYGNKEIMTPNIDVLAAQGTKFTQFHVTSGVCSPSRVSVITGHFPARHSVHAHFARNEFNKERGMPNWLDETLPVYLPRTMQKAGYATAHFGKWHLAGGGEPNGDLTAPQPGVYGYDETRVWNGNGLAGYLPASVAGSTGGLKGRKVDIFEGGVNVPFIVRWPGHVDAGKTDETSLISTVDLLPTFCELAGDKLPENYRPDGESFVSIFKNTPFVRTKPLFWEWRFAVENAKPAQVNKWPILAVRQGNWKLLANKTRTRIELYDISTDRLELRNIAQANPEKVRQLLSLWDEWKSELPE